MMSKNHTTDFSHTSYDLSYSRKSHDHNILDKYLYIAYGVVQSEMSHNRMKSKAYFTEAATTAVTSDCNFSFRRTMHFSM